MKEGKIHEKDLIKDKYLKKVGIFKKIAMKWNDFKAKAKSDKSLTEDKQILASSLINIIVYGIAGSLISTLFGFQINILNFFGIGCMFWLLETKVIGFITSILHSIKLVEIKY